MKIAFFLPFTSFQFQFLSLVLVFFQKAHRDCFCCRLLPFLDVVAWDFAGKYINLYISDCVWIILMHLHKIFTQPAPRSAERAIENLRSCNKSCMICVYTIPRNLRQILCLSLSLVCVYVTCYCANMLTRYVQQLNDDARTKRVSKTRRWWWKALCKEGENPLTIAHD